MSSSCVICHWLRYFLLMACAPHLSFMLMVLALIMTWIFPPKMGYEGVFGVCAVFGGGCCGKLWTVPVGKGGGDGGGGGNSDWACCRASLMILGTYSYVVWNSSRASKVRFSLIWICSSVVIPYMYSLSRHFWDFVSMSVVKLAYVGLDCHACSSGVFFYGECAVCSGSLYFVFPF